MATGRNTDTLTSCRRALWWGLYILVTEVVCELSGIAQGVWVKFILHSDVDLNGLLRCSGRLAVRCKMNIQGGNNGAFSL
jgi:hypothetical protein